MKKARNILITGTVMPALLLAQCGGGFAQIAPSTLQMAQAPAPEPKGEEHRPPKGPPAGGAPAAPPHQAPHPAAPAAPAPAAPVQRAPAPPPVAAPPHVAPTPHVQAPAAVPAPHAPAPVAPTPHVQAPAAVPAPHAPTPHVQAPAATPQVAPKRAAEPAHPAAAPAAAPPPVERRPDRAAEPGGPPHAARPATPAAAPVAPAAQAPAAVAPAPAAQAPVPQGRQAPAAAAPDARPPGQGRPPGTAGRPAGGPGGPGQGGPGGPGGPGAPQQGQNGGQPGGGGGIGTGGALAIGAAAGLVGGFLAASGARGIDDIRRDRREVNEGGVNYIREPGRTIVRDGDRSYVVHDENERFRDLGLGVRTEQRGGDNVAIFDRPGGEQILTFTDGEGRLIRRVRRFRDGREVVIIDNGYQGRVRDFRDDVVVLPPEPLRIPRERFVVEADGADEAALYDTLVAPPVAPVAQRYTLDQVRYSPDLRGRMRSVDVDTLNFDPGSWIVPPDQANKLQILGSAVKKAVARNANEVFLVEGYTDATGNPTDNLSLSDRRAQSVATILTRDFGVPPENLTTQGYGQQYLKEQTQASSRVNRRVTLRRITPLLAASGGAAPR